MSGTAGVTARGALIAVILASGTVMLDGTVLTVALPAIARDLGGGLAGQQWVFNAYLLTTTSLLIVGGALGDRYGRRRVLLIGIAGFGLTGLLACFAWSIESLIAARLLKGVFAAAMVPAGLAVITEVYADPVARGRAFGAWTAWTSVASLIGPLVGGLVVDLASWRWVFVVPLAPLAVAAWFVARSVPAGAVAPARPIDWAGSVLAVTGLAGTMFALIEGPVLGWASPAVLIAGLGGAASLIAFVLVERRVAAPMLPPGLFRIRTFAVCLGVTFLVTSGMNGISFVLPLFSQTVLGLSATVAGLVLVPATLMLMAFSTLAGQWAGRYGSRRFVIAGPLITAVGLVILSGMAPGMILPYLLPGMVALGGGIALTIAPLTTALMSSVPADRTGVASSVQNLVSRATALFAVAAVGVVMAVGFGLAIAPATARLDLGPAEVAALAAAQATPGGDSVPVGIDPSVSAAIVDAWQAAFRAVMLVAALMSTLGSVLAAVLLPASASRPSEVQPALARAG